MAALFPKATSINLIWNGWKKNRMDPDCGQTKKGNIEILD